MSQSKSKSSNGRQHSSRDHTPVINNKSLYVKVKFTNNLPDIPFDPKFLVNPLDVSRFVDYETTSLEQNAKHELLTTPNLGVDIDLILPERYAVPAYAEHDPDDDRLLNDDEPTIDKTKKSPRDKPHSQLHNKVVPWLKKTEYISTEYNRYGSSSEKTETKVGYSLRKNLKEEEVFLDKESQIKAIDATFEAAKIPIDKHPTKPDVYAKKVSPLLPAFSIWKYFFAHAKFDSEPAEPSRVDQMSQAIMKGAHDDETDENFVVYFLPTEITMADRLLDQKNGLDYTEDKEYEYKSTRDYSWSARSKLTDDFFFVFRDDAVYYNRLSMEVILKKRRNKSQGATSTLILKHRDLIQDEMDEQEKKLRELSKPLPVTRQEADLTAQSLEQSYEDMALEGQAITGGDTAAADTIASPDAEMPDEASSSSASSSSAASSVASSSSASSSEASEDDNDSNDD